MKPVNRVGLLLFLVAARAEAQQAGWPFVNIILSTSQSRTFAAATLSDGQLDLTCSVDLAPEAGLTRFGDSRLKF